MGIIDRLLATTQLSWNLVAAVFLRYVDDLRIYLQPISAGWYWTEVGWCYDAGRNDQRDPDTRTCEELAKSLNSIMEFNKFTTEKEHDYESGFLPTLDFQTRVMKNGKIIYKFFIKPMSNNTTIQFGTGLPKNTIFSVLRQELIRGMLNFSPELVWEERLKF